MDIEAFKKEIESRVIDIINRAQEDLTKYQQVKILSDEQAKIIADGLEAQKHIVTVFESKAEKRLNKVRRKELIHVAKDFSVLHFTFMFGKSYWPRLSRTMEQVKKKYFPGLFYPYLYCGESCWNWTHALETKPVLTKDGLLPPGTFKKCREIKEIELAKRSVNFAVNTILIYLYERLIAQYPKDIGLYSALSSVLENSCLFDRRIELLETVFERFSDYWIGVELMWAYRDNCDFKNANRVKKLLEKKEKKQKDA